jgi:hypothetical protein
VKDLENKKILGVPLGTVAVLVIVGIAVYVITMTWGSKILGWINKGKAKLSMSKTNA